MISYFSIEGDCECRKAVGDIYEPIIQGGKYTKVEKVNHNGKINLHFFLFSIIIYRLLIKSMKC